MTEREEIRAEQEYRVADVERQLAEGTDPVLVNGRGISREAAWAAAAAIRKSWELNGLYDGQERRSDGSWLANVQVPIGRFEG